MRQEKLLSQPLSVYHLNWHRKMIRQRLLKEIAAIGGLQKKE